MSIATAITAAKNKVISACTTLETKEGVHISVKNLTNLASSINKLGLVINKEVINGVYQTPISSFTFNLPINATDVRDYALYQAFYNCTGLTSVDLSSLTTVSGQYGLSYAFYNCTGLTSVDLSALTTVSGNNGLQAAFNGCTGLTSADLSALTNIGSYGLDNAFFGCTGLTSVDLSALTTVSSNGLAYTFAGCKNITSINFLNLTSINSINTLNYTFQQCTSLTSISFPALTTSSFGTYKNQFNYMMQNTGTNTTHTLHFPSNLQSTISGLSGYPLFSGTSGYVVLAFDLPATS